MWCYIFSFIVSLVRKNISEKAMKKHALIITTCFLLVLPFHLKATAPIAPTNLRSYDKTNPVGTDQKPFFGWYVNDPDNDEIQTAFQLLVASSLQNLNAGKGDLWDSGKTTSGRQNHLEYAGKPLKPATRYFWKVRTWDKDGNVSVYSKPATFDVGLLNAADWAGAKWIRRASTDKDDYTYYRKSFLLSGKTIKRATAYLSAWHNYELYLNGCLVGKGQAYHYPQYSYYNAYDITSNLKTHTRNVFACLTHWFGGGQGRVPGAPGFLMKTVIEYMDGTSVIIGTDASWRQTRVEAWLTGQPTRNGEGVGYVDKIDASKILKNWNRTVFDDTSWANATEIGTHPVSPWTGELQPDLTRLVEKERIPVSVKKLGTGKYLIDLGKVYAGVPKITFGGGQAGDVVNIHGGYTLEEDGTVSLSQTQKTNMNYYFILDGKTAVFKPFVYLGMRYLQVENSPNVLTTKNVRFITRHYELDPSRSSFHSSNSMLNQVWDLMKHSLLLGAQEQFVDTPTREKGAFLGDGWSQGVPAMTTMGDRAYNLRIMLEFLDSQDQYWPDGRLNAVYPNVDGKRDIPDYTQSYLVWVWDYYLQTGDVQFLRENYSKIRKVAEYVETYKNPSTGLIHNLAGGGGPYQYGIIDWPSSMRYGYDVSTEARTVICAYAYIDFNIVSKVADVLGIMADKALYQTKAQDMKEAINTQLINAKGVYIDGLYADKTPASHVSQHANMFPMAMGIVPDIYKDSVIAAIKSRKMNVGMVTVRWLPEALGKAEQGPHLIELYTNPTWDGWAQTISRGGTATWEAWDSPEREESLSHPWGAVGLLGIEQYILGVEPLKPQYELIQVKPLDFGTSLLHAEGKLPSDRGDIRVNWSRSDATFTMTVALPDNMKACVWVPKGSLADADVLVDGKHVQGEIKGNYIRIDQVGSGTHQFVRAVQ
jgi:alpha-L-rhamnosidase